MTLALFAQLAAYTFAAAPPETSTVAVSQTMSSTMAEFVKGEIANAGSIRLVPISSFIGARVGGLIEDRKLYLTVAPKIDLLLIDKRLRIGVEVPLNFEIYSAQTAADNMSAKEGFKNLGSFRKQDWETCTDTTPQSCKLSAAKVVRVLRYISYGHKEDNLYIDVGQLYAVTIGHGQAMRRYAANVDFNSYIVGAELDAYDEYGGFEMSIADVTRGNIFAALGFVKPLFLVDSPIARSWSIGLSWASDQKAPYNLLRGPPIGSSVLGVVIVDPETGLPKYDARAVNIMGVDSEIKIYKDESIDIKTYADFSALHGGGNGLTAGVLGRFNFRGESTLQVLRTRLELRTYDANFQPSYFDVMYELQKIQYITDLNSPSSPTKLKYILSRTGSRRVGAYLEASYALADWFIVAAALETDSTGQDRNLMLHAELPFRFLNLFATYQQRGFANVATLDKNDLLFAGARLQILPILWINGRFQKNIAWDTAQFQDLGGFKNQIKFQIDAEFGYQF
jgi:hypothetical protein